MKSLKRRIVACYKFFTKYIGMCKPIFKRKYFLIWCLLIFNLTICLIDRITSSRKFPLALLFFRCITLLIAILTNYLPMPMAFSSSDIVLWDNNGSSGSNSPLGNTPLPGNQGGESSSPIIPSRNNQGGESSSLIIPSRNNQGDASSSDNIQSKTVIKLEKNIEESRSKVLELRSLFEKITSDMNNFRERILIAQEPTVIRTSVYSSHNPDRYGTDPISRYDGMDPCCTRNAPYNAINHLNSMEGNMKWIVKINETYPNICLYIYDQNEHPTVTVKDESFNMLDKTIVIYNGKMEMDQKDLEFLRNCICSFMYSDSKVEMNLCIGQNQYNKMPAYLRPNSPSHPHPVSIRDYENLPNLKISKVNNFYNQFNKRPIVRFY